MIRRLALVVAAMFAAPFAMAQQASGDLSPAAQAVLEAWRTRFETAKAEAAKMPADTLAQELQRRVHVEQGGRAGIGEIRAANLPPDQHQRVMDAMGVELSAEDAVNTAWLKTVIPADGWFRNSHDGAALAHDAWLIVQHSPDRQFQKDVLAKMGPLAEQGEVRGGDYALLHDRVELFEGRPQRYGSQGTCVNGVLTLHTLEDPVRVDELRAKVRLGPLKDYEKILGIGRRC